MKEEKKYPEGSEGLYNANDLPSIALMKIQMETLKQEVFILRGEIDRLQNIIFPCNRRTSGLRPENLQTPCSLTARGKNL